MGLSDGQVKYANTDDLGQYFQTVSTVQNSHPLSSIFEVERSYVKGLNSIQDSCQVHKGEYFYTNLAYVTRYAMWSTLYIWYVYGLPFT